MLKKKKKMGAQQRNRRSSDGPPLATSKTTGTQNNDTLLGSVSQCRKKSELMAVTGKSVQEICILT